MDCGRDFITAVRTDSEVHPDFEDGVRYMELTEAIFRSVESGKRISLPLSDNETI
jgi:predicted dehydrogenase